jgi:hypothetical protein
MDELADHLAALVVDVCVKHLSKVQTDREFYGLALMFEWGVCDWTMWAPLPVMLDSRRLSVEPMDDPIRGYWDPWVPPAALWARAEEIDGGLVGALPGVSEELEADRTFRELGEDLEKRYFEWGQRAAPAGGEESDLGPESRYAIEVARRLGARDLPALGLSTTADFVTFPVTTWPETLELVRAAVPPRQLAALRQRGKLA